MAESEIMEALKDSYQEIKSRKTRIRFGDRTDRISSFRRYLLYFTDVLDIYLSIQRDRRWRRDEKDDW